MMRNKLKIKILNPWFIFNIPALIMFSMLCFDYKLHKPLLLYSGYASLAFLTTVLLLNPLKTFRPKWLWVIKLNRYRRQIGVASFFCVFIHLSCFVIKRLLDGFWKSLVYFLHPAIIPAFFIAFPIFIVLAITSNNYSVKKLTFPKWKKIHKLVYIAEIAVMVHMVLMGGTRLMLSVFIPLCFLQIRRSRTTQKVSQKL